MKSLNEEQLWPPTPQQQHGEQIPPCVRAGRLLTPGLQRARAAATG